MKSTYQDKDLSSGLSVKTKTKISRNAARNIEIQMTIAFVLTSIIYKLQ